MLFAICRTRGIKRLPLFKPDTSERNNCIPPTPNIGKMATAKIIMPKPPNQLSKCRQKFKDGASVSKLAIIVAPVVVKPETASK